MGNTLSSSVVLITIPIAHTLMICSLTLKFNLWNWLGDGVDGNSVLHYYAELDILCPPSVAHMLPLSLIHVVPYKATLQEH